MDNKDTKTLKERRFEDAQKRLLKIEQEIEEHGGLVMDGLYHGARRVRAEYKILSPIEGWLLSPTEIDLIAALKTDKIPYDVNEVDLQKKYGLTIQGERAPVEVSISEYGYVEIERTDEWGDGAKPWEDHSPWHTRIMDDWSFKGILLLIALLPCALTMPVSNRLTSKVNRIILLTVFSLLILCGLFGGFKPYFHLSEWEAVFMQIALLYLCTALLPFFGNGFQKRRI